jgi:hypothetical protein
MEGINALVILIPLTPLYSSTNTCYMDLSVSIDVMLIVLITAQAAKYSSN